MLATVRGDGPAGSAEESVSVNNSLWSNKKRYATAQVIGFDPRLSCMYMLFLCHWDKRVIKTRRFMPAVRLVPTAHTVGEDDLVLLMCISFYTGSHRPFQWPPSFGAPHRAIHAGMPVLTCTNCRSGTKITKVCIACQHTHKLTSSPGTWCSNPQHTLQLSGGLEGGERQLLPCQILLTALGRQVRSPVPESNKGAETLHVVHYQLTL